MPFYVFGYGSLILRPGFEYTEYKDGYIQGYSRVFYQGSTDHRGVPGAPGRVVTLIESSDPTARCYGRAFLVSFTPEKEAEIRAYLEHREKQFDVRLFLDVMSEEGNVVAPQALTFIATAASPNYLGPAPDEEIAKTIAASVGPSGRNCDYLFSVANALRGIGVEDEHVFSLEQRVLSLIHEIEAKATPTSVAGSPQSVTTPSTVASEGFDQLVR